MKRQNVLGAVFVTVFLDLLGFGMLFPLLPTYAADLGASATLVGLLIASYSAAQLVAAPVLGRASDRWGRGPIVAASALGAALGYAVLFLADAMTGLFVGRIITGLCAGNIAAAQATISDVTTPEERGRGMAVVGAAIGLGIIFGPALTALSVPLAGEKSPFAIAAVLALANAVWAARALPRTRGTSPRLLTTLGRAARHPALVLLLSVNFLVMVAFSQIESQLPLLTRHTMGFGPVENGYLFMYVGVVIVVFQLTGTRWLSSRLGDERLIVLGLGCFALGAALAPFVTTWWQVLLPAGLIGVGNATQAPSLMAAISKQAGADEQGAILGASQSLGSSGRIVGPVLGGALFAEVAPPAPYLAGGVAFAVIAAAFVVLDRRVT
ncbi:MFS transporter [Janibacter indicus]|uniref:MFS transporter, DHA1 family, tetracycline resistance protein n=1 Tax=Janibacter indicus TaxID=857417 RepID=A0A1W1YDG9_9MICO|nr:MFS transporter [Janibacter indicus]SMC33818.1 MFS transporter, DHA1 family, tetracycline resistance protein [Janibacter indicus]